ncbi:hypothetical protein D3C73_1409210 [compost metagenome]
MPVHHHVGGEAVEESGAVIFIGIKAVHDQAEDRRLYPPDRQYALNPFLLRGKGIGTGHIETIELIANAAGQRLL